MPIEIPTNRLDYTSPRIWTTYVRDLPLPGMFKGERWLPFKDVEADRILVEIGKWARPIAPFSDIDAEAGTINRGPIITNAWFDALHVKVKERFKASDFRWLRLYGDRPVTDPAGRMADAQRRRVAEAVDDLNMSVDTRIEWLRMNTLLGRVTQAPNADSDVDVDIQYPVTAVTATTLWSDTANADPIMDIWNWVKGWMALGVRFTTMIAPLEVTFNLMRNARLRGEYSSPTFTPALVSMQQINDRLSAQFGLRIEEYNAVYTVRTDDGVTATDTSYPLMPTNKIILLPDEQLGYTGTVPQELNNWQTGKYTWRNDPSNNPGMQDPIRHEMGVGWGGMPILLFPNRIIVGTVG